jgi:DNA adenine methylase
MLGTVLKYPGSKWRLADWIVSHLPAHTTYLEPYFGSGAVFFRKQPSKVETINDIDNNVVNLFRVIREQSEELAAMIEMTPWSREEYMATEGVAGDYLITTGDPLEDARRFLVRMWQGRGSKTSDRSGWRNDIQGRGPHVKSWAQLPNRILAIAVRLKQAQIECRPALELIAAYRYKEVLIYADPPYPLSTRSNRMYKNEMSDSDHRALLEVLNRHPGPVILSSYACPLYDKPLTDWGWAKETQAARAELGREREEVLWFNPTAAGRMKQMRLFKEA